MIEIKINKDEEKGRQEKSQAMEVI